MNFLTLFCMTTYVLLALASPSAVLAQNQWIRQFGTPEQDGAAAIALSGGALYVAGTTTGVMPGQVNAGSGDAFVRKLDVSGNVLWTRQFGTAEYDSASAVAADDTGVYVGGVTRGAVSSGDAAFVRKYDANGNELWTRQFATPAPVAVSGIAADGAVIYVVVRLAPQSPALVSSSVRKYDPAGNLLWTVPLDNRYVTGVALHAGGVYLSEVPQEGRGAFLSKYDANGSPQWSKPYPGAAWTVAADQTGVYVAGNVNTADPEHLLVEKHAHANGELLWNRRFGPSTWDGITTIAADGAAVTLAGHDAHTGRFNQDSFVRRYDSTGNLLWSRFLNTSGTGVAGIALDATGVYLTGTTDSIEHWTSPSDAFVLRIETQPPPLQFVPVTPCRIADTRASGGFESPFGPPSMAGNTTRSFPIPRSRCGIPEGARGYSLNVTAIPGGRLDYVSVWPTGYSQPLVSTLNSFHGGIVSNAVLIEAGFNGGAVSVYVSNGFFIDIVIDINGYFLSEAGPSALSFYTLDPCRVVDTRDPFRGSFGSPSLAGGASRSFRLPDASCRIPAGAGAYSLNATAVPKTVLSYLTLWPSGLPTPVVSTLNSFDGTVVANAAIVPGGAQGAVSAFVTETADLVLDTNGFFGPSGSPGELRFVPVIPCRLADTRDDPPRPMLSGETRDFPVAGRCNVPASAKAYVLNVTVVPNGPLSYLTLWPAGATMPLASTLNSFLGRVTANAAIAPAGLTGSVSVYVTNTTHVVLDINGYFQ